MPHLILEYSTNVAEHSDLKNLLVELHETIAQTESFDRERVKSRLAPREDFIVGDPAKGRAFVAVSIAIMPGRSVKLRQTLGKRLHELLVKRLGEMNKGLIDCSITLEIREVDPEFFFRDPS